MRRRLAAIVALVVGAATIALAVAVAVTEFPRGLGILGCVVVAGAAAWYGVLRRGISRVVGLTVAALALAGAVALLVAGGSLLAELLVIAGRDAADDRGTDGRARAGAGDEVPPRDHRAERLVLVVVGTDLGRWCAAARLLLFSDRHPGASSPPFPRCCARGSPNADDLFCCRVCRCLLLHTPRGYACAYPARSRWARPFVVLGVHTECGQI